MYFRSKASNTGKNADLIINIINDPNTLEVTLFASEKIEHSPNAPLMFALAKYPIEAIEEVIYIAFDNNVSTAQRFPRYREVEKILDASESSSKVMFSKTRIPYTAAMTPEEAINLMLEQAVTEALTSDTRAEFFSMLSNITESEMLDVFGIGQ